MVGTWIETNLKIIMKKKLNFIWCLKSKYEINFSFDWICEMFQQFDIVHNYDIENSFSTYLDNSIIVVSVGKGANDRLCEYLQNFNLKNLNYTVIHLSDEAFEQNIDFYKFSKRIVRNYYNKEYTQQFPILTVPLGYQTGVKPQQIHKSLMVNFVGQIKSDRYEMLNYFQKFSNKYFYLTQQWNDPNSLNHLQYSQVLSSSFYTLCPRGWVSLDSFRINESLECGSIPISVLDKDGSDYFSLIYGEHPFIIGSNWENAYDKMFETDHIKKLDQVKDWWMGFKNNLSLKLVEYTT